MAQLIIEKATDDTLTGKVTPIPQDGRMITIGRREPSAIVLDDQLLSRVHARIGLRFGEWRVEDLESRNGVYLKVDPGEWTKISKSKIADGSAVRIGSTVFRFRSTSVAELEGREVEDCRLDSVLFSDAGVTAYAGWQLAMDRAIRVDSFTLDAVDNETLDSLRKSLEVAAEMATTVEGPGLATLARVNFTEPECSSFALLTGNDSITFDDRMTEIQAQPIAVRLRCFRLLAEAVLTRSEHAALCYPIGLRHIGWTSDLQPEIPTLDLSPWLANAKSFAVHCASLIPYLPPEKISAKLAPRDRDASRESVVYNLGALGYHLLTGSPPMGDGSPEQVLKNHLRRAPSEITNLEIPAPVSSLLQRMLAKNIPGRPTTTEAILEPLRESSASTPTPPPRPAASIAVSAPSATGDTPVQPNSPPAHIEVPDAPAPLALLLPIWIILWSGIFVSTRLVTALVLERLGE